MSALQWHASAAVYNSQRYCDADEARLKSESAPIEYEIYFQAVLYTLIAGWLFMDNVKLWVQHALPVLYNALAGAAH